MNSSAFPHQIRVYRPKTGSPAIGAQRQDGKFEFDGLVTEENRYTVLYEGNGDLQDILKKDERTQQGGPDRIATGVIFLEIEDSIYDIKTDDTVEITHATGRIEYAVVVEVRHIDGAMYVQRINQV